MTSCSGGRLAPSWIGCPVTIPRTMATRSSWSRSVTPATEVRAELLGGDLRQQNLAKGRSALPELRVIPDSRDRLEEYAGTGLALPIAYAVLGPDRMAALETISRELVALLG
jgi:hypothetical protein